MSEKKKKEKKPKTEGAAKRKSTPWVSKQLGRAEKAIKSLTKLNGIVSAAKAPNVDASHVEKALTHATALHAQLAALAHDWKPAKGMKPGTSKKVGIGSIVMVKPDLNRDEVKMFKHIPADTFAKAVVLDDDGRYWLVKCADGVTRVLSKKLTAKAPEVETAAEAA